MRKLLALVLACMMVFSATAVFAAKGASDTAREKASPQAIFNRMTDWFATVGKSEEEKQQILAERKAKRAAKQAEKEAKKAAAQAEEKMKKGKKALDAKMKGMGR